MSDAERPVSKRIVLKKRTGKKSAKKKAKGKRPLTQLKKKAPASKPSDTSPMAKPLVEAPLPRKGTAAPSATPQEGLVEQQFDFFCPYCAKPNTAEHGQEGSAISCGDCGNTITVPPPLAEPPTAAAAKSATKPMLRFFCSICGQKLSALAEAAGAKTVCPACNSSIAVPQNQPAPPESQDDEDHDESFKFHCQGCGKRFEARRSWTGRPFVCPSCSAENTVPDAPD